MHEESGRGDLGLVFTPLQELHQFMAEEGVGGGEGEGREDEDQFMAEEGVGGGEGEGREDEDQFMAEEGVGGGEGEGREGEDCLSLHSIKVSVHWTIILAVLWTCMC